MLASGTTRPASSASSEAATWLFARFTSCGLAQRAPAVQRIARSASITTALVRISGNTLGADSPGT